MEHLQDPANRLFELARQAARPTRWWFVPLLLLLFSLAGAPGALIPLETAGDAGLWWSAVESAGFLAAAYIPVAILVALWIWRREKRSPLSLGFNRSGAMLHMLFGFGFGAGMIGLGTALLVTSGTASLTFDQTNTGGWIALAPGLLVLAGWAIQGLTEEMMFRGWMLQNSGVQLGPLLGISVSIFLFALAHIGNPGITPLSAFNLSLIGILFTLIALLEGGIWAASGFHIAWNWAQSNIFGFNVSGLEIGGGSLVRIIPTEDGMTGGEFGFEGSVAATTTIMIGIIIVLALASRRGSPATDDAAGLTR